MVHGETINEESKRGVCVRKMLGRERKKCESRKHTREGEGK